MSVVTSSKAVCSAEEKDFLRESKSESQRGKERKSEGEGGREKGNGEREEWRPLFYQRQNKNILT